MSLFTPFDVPDFKPIIPPDTKDSCRNARERWVVEQLSVATQANRWQAEKLVELSKQFELFYRQGTNLRNELAGLKESMLSKEIAVLKSQSLKEKTKEWGVMVALILGLTGLYDLVKSRFVNESKPANQQKTP